MDIAGHGGAQMTRRTALALYNCGWWKDLNARDILSFQLFEDRLCMPISLYQQCLTEVLGRPIFTHEMGTTGWEEMKAEFLANTQMDSEE
jgi:hypothetical protein